jgi:acyl-CoA thioesterase II
MSDLKDLLSVLELQPADGGFTAGNMDEGHGVVFGGQLLAQAVVAATRAVEGKQLKSLHTVFARSARPDAPLTVDVDTMHEGRAFASTTVTVRQEGRVCTRSLALLHAPDDDLIRYAGEPPEAGSPDDWAPLAEAGSLWDLRIAGDVDISDPAAGPPTLDVWARFDGAPSDPVTGQALVAYASDGFLIATAMRPHEGLSQADAHVRVSTTVLSQTITFHEPIDASGWVLLAHRSPYAGRGRSYGQAEVWVDGALVASYVQENMIRAFPEGAAPAAGERAKH